MHCIASCLCFWFYLIMSETYVTMVEAKVLEMEGLLAEDHTTKHMSFMKNSEHEEEEGSGGLLGADEDCDKIATFSHNCYVDRVFKCTVANEISQKVGQFAPFLFPFSIEFNILIGNFFIDLSCSLYLKIYFYSWCLDHYVV